MKINANFQSFASAHFNAQQYLASPSLGVNRFLLDRVGNEMARATTIVEYQPNAHFPKHEHVGGEEYLVLSGTFHDEHGTYPVGTYVRNPIGSQHAPWVEQDGCVIFVKLLQMAENNKDDLATTNPSPLRVNIDRNSGSNNNDYKATAYGSVLDLYHNPQAGERVQMCWINPNTVFSISAGDDNDKDNDIVDAADGGEELFVYQGTLKTTVSNNDDDEKQGENVEEEYGAWAWLRFPPVVASPTPGTSRERRGMLVRAGSQGAHVYRKTGHLTEKAMSMEKIQIDPATEKVVAVIPR